MFYFTACTLVVQLLCPGSSDKGATLFTKAEEFSCIRCFRGGFLIRACSSSHDKQMCILLSIVFASAMAFLDFSTTCVYGCVLLFCFSDFLAWQ